MSFPFLLVSIISVLLCFSPAASAHFVEDEQEHEMEKEGQKKKLERYAKLDPWKLLEYALTPAANAANSQVNCFLQGHFRIIKATGLPDHATGEFPGPYCPSTIYEQNYTWRMPANPQLNGYITPLHMYPFGVALNGIPFDPFANEFWQGNRRSGWQFEAMVLGKRLGLDDSNAHVQPDGAYHYHGLPNKLIQKMSLIGRPVLVGYAADGFPIYGPIGYANANDKSSRLIELHSSYRIRSGLRPDGPRGTFDGTFVQDYEFVDGNGDLDECNGRFGVTSEFPNGTYYYVITSTFPFIPRYFRGTPDPSFMMRGHLNRPPPPMGGPRGWGHEPPAGNGMPPSSEEYERQLNHSRKRFSNHNPE